MLALTHVAEPWPTAGARLMKGISPILIDGAFGEGGGQILRTSLSLSLLLGIPFRMVNIRAGRKKPGLMAQHLACVKAACAIGGDAEGAHLCSQRISFCPRAVQAGEYRFDIGTAGSTSLLLQTILLPLAWARRPSIVLATGGTHVPFSPIHDYLEHVYLPMIGAMGIHAHASLTRFGFFPKGGGFVQLEIRPLIKNVAALSLSHPGELQSIRLVSVAANLPREIAWRQASRAKALLQPLKANAHVQRVNAASPGTYLFLLAGYEHGLAGFSCLGARGKPAETVAEETVDAFLKHHRSQAALDEHLADQLILPMALANGESKFVVSHLTSHLQTNIEVVRIFTGIRCSLLPCERGIEIRIPGIGLQVE